MRIIDCRRFKEMLVSAANNLDNQHLAIDKLNVFPVPDGDTGTNMNMTFFDAVNDTCNYNNSNIGDCAKFLSKRMLMGARGNSGVILSQIFKGLAKSLDGMDKITVDDMANGFVASYQSAYKAVMRPVEGTILTVIREIADYGYYYYENHKNCSFEEYFDYLLAEGRKSLERTPDLLPILKEVGVVDSGAAGLVAIIEGIQSYFRGKPIQNKDKRSLNPNEEGYSLECSIELNERYKKEFDNDAVYSLLANSCSDIRIKRENNTVIIHVHTLKPAEPMAVYIRYGTIVQTGMEPLSRDNNKAEKTCVEPSQHEKYAIIAVCTGKGIAQLFNTLHAKYIVSGGQTMNPSTQDFVNVIDEIDADHIIILPNNPNIILAAQQAKSIASEKNITVLQSKTICEGTNACIAFDESLSLDENIAAMNEAINSIKTLSVTHSIKDTTINNVSVKEGEYIGICGKEIRSHGSNLIEITKELLDRSGVDDCSVATVYYGLNINKQDAQQILDYLTETYDVEGQLVDGQQDLYPFIIGVE